MTLRIGVIGVGMIGQDHIRRLTEVLAGGSVVAVSDVDHDRARKIASTLPGCTSHVTGEELIADPNVDAVVVTTWGPTHEEFVLAAIEAGKPVFCEKPLATTREACERIMSAESGAGQRLVQVGFMRRFDASYRALKDAVDSGRIGAALMMHCAHRMPEAAPNYTSEMAITDCLIHEIDLVRWLFNDEIAAVRVLKPRGNSNTQEGVDDPLFVLIELGSGILVDVEVSANIRYGYDIRGEVVGESGTVALADNTDVVHRIPGVDRQPRGEQAPRWPDVLGWICGYRRRRRSHRGDAHRQPEDGHACHETRLLPGLEAILEGDIS